MRAFLKYNQARVDEGLDPITDPLVQLRSLLTAERSPEVIMGYRWRSPAQGGMRIRERVPKKELGKWGGTSLTLLTLLSMGSEFVADAARRLGYRDADPPAEDV